MFQNPLAVPLQLPVLQECREKPLSQAAFPPLSATANPGPDAYLNCRTALSSRLPVRPFQPFSISPVFTKHVHMQHLSGDFTDRDTKVKEVMWAVKVQGQEKGWVLGLNPDLVAWKCCSPEIIFCHAPSHPNLQIFLSASQPQRKYTQHVINTGLEKDSRRPMRISLMGLNVPLPEETCKLAHMIRLKFFLNYHLFIFGWAGSPLLLGLSSGCGECGLRSRWGARASRCGSFSSQSTGCWHRINSCAV